MGAHFYVQLLRCAQSTMAICSKSNCLSPTETNATIYARKIPIVNSSGEPSPTFLNSFLLFCSIKLAYSIFTLSFSPPLRYYEAMSGRPSQCFLFQSCGRKVENATFDCLLNRENTLGVEPFVASEEECQVLCQKVRPYLGHVSLLTVALIVQ